MPEQNYQNHRQFVTLYHKVILPILILTFLGSIVNLWQSWGDHQRIYSASLIAVLTLCTVFVMFFARVFALRAQDRAIYAEQNLRHFSMTGKLLDTRLTVPQVIALRFAPDDEFLPLCRRAAEENLTNDAVKRAIKNWRADNYRV